MMRNKMKKKTWQFRPPTDPVQTKRRGPTSNNSIDSNIISRPHSGFFNLVFKNDVIIWIFYHPQIFSFQNKNLLEMVKKSYVGFQNVEEMPIVTNQEELKMWTSKYQCKVIIDELLYHQFSNILSNQNVLYVHIVTAENMEIARYVRRSQYLEKIRTIEDDYTNILHYLMTDMEKYALRKNQAEAEQKNNVIKSKQTALQRVKLPNMMKLTIHEKANLLRYRNNLYCLTKLHENKVDFQSSKKRFIEQCEYDYPSQKDKEHIRHYLTYPRQDKEILTLYTQQSYFHKCINNTMRIALTTEDFFTIGEPFNKLFHAIRNLYHQQFPFMNQEKRRLKLFRGADLTATECEFLQKSIGSFIEIHGFVSTSKSQEVAKEFSKMRNHNKIIQIQIQENTCTDEKILNSDNGFVDLQMISSYNESEILFNSLNIFQVAGKEVRGQFEYYKLKYGGIYNILQKDPSTLDQNSRFAYYSFKELMNYKDDLDDIGQVFLKNNETSKAVKYYQKRLDLLPKQSQRQIKEELILRHCEALVENGDPTIALQKLEALITQRANIKSKRNIMIKSQKYIEPIDNSQAQMYKTIVITDQYSLVKTKLDGYETAQETIASSSQQLSSFISQHKNQWDPQISISQIELKLKLIYVKEVQMLYSQEYDELVSALTLVNEFIAKGIQQQVQSSYLRHVYMLKTFVLQALAKICHNLTQIKNSKKFTIPQILEQYQKTEDKLKQYIQDAEYDKMILSIRKFDIKRQSEKYEYDRDSAIKKLIKYAQELRSRSAKDEQIPKIYQILAQIERKLDTSDSIRRAITYFQKQYILQTQYYGQNDPRTMRSLNQISYCLQKINEPQDSIDLMKEQLKTTPYKTVEKHSSVAKTLYVLGVSYYSVREYNLALKSFEKAHQILRELLSPKDFGRSMYRYKIEFQIGKTYTSIKEYPLAEQYLFNYHNFVVKTYTDQHSDIANSLNQIGIYYMKLKKFDISFQKFDLSEKMFILCQGQKSLASAKIACNKALILAYYKNFKEAIRNVDIARGIFDFHLQQVSNAQKVMQSKLPKRVHSQASMIYYYYAEITRLSRNFGEAIQFYEKSIRSEAEYKEYKKQLDFFQRKTNLRSTFLRKYSLVRETANQKELHQCLCTLRIFQCKAQAIPKNLDMIPEIQNFVQIMERDVENSVERSNFVNDRKESEIANRLTRQRYIKDCNNVILDLRGMKTEMKSQQMSFR